MKMLAWTGTISSIIGSFLVAFGIFTLGYVAFLTGAINWLIVARARRDAALALLNTVFMVANIIGLIRYTF